MNLDTIIQIFLALFLSLVVAGGILIALGLYAVHERAQQKEHHASRHHHHRR